MPKKGSGALFQEDAHGAFIRLTGSRYDAMDDRMERKGLPPLNFSKAQYRSHILAAMNGHEDGFVQCRFCRGFFGIKDLASDHEMPLSRGGSHGLDNIGFPCKNCNAAKGALSPEEFLKLLAFLENEIPLGRKDVLGRLAISVQLAAGARGNAATIGDLKKSGAWKEAQTARRKAKQSKGGF